MKKLETTMLCLILASVGLTSVVPTSMFRNHAVFQTSDEAGQPAIISGTESKGTAGSQLALVILHLTTGKTSKLKTTTDKDGYWAFKFDMKSDGPFNLTLIADGQSLQTITDVYFGDVYFCSGQSNMQYPVHDTRNGTQEIAAANHPNMRFMNLDDFGGHGVPNKAGVRIPQSNLPIDIPWQIVTPDIDTIGQMSAVCYYTLRNVMFARKSSQGNRAIGMVHSAVGGTPVEDWTPAETVAKCGLAPDLPIPQDGGDGNTTWSEPGNLFNQMVTPFVNASFRAVLWYQGEANSGEGYSLEENEYECVFREMIQAWRVAFRRPDLPFLFMQLSGCCDGKESWDWIHAGITSAQSRVAAVLDNVGMALSYDWGGPTGVHTPWKEVPSLRLSYQVRKYAFGEKTPTRPELYGACVYKYATDEDPISQVLIRVRGASQLVLKPTMECTSTCCNATDSTDPVQGLAKGVAAIETLARGARKWYDGAIQLSDDGDGLLISANTGATGPQASKTTHEMIWAVRFAEGANPNCVMYNEFDLPLIPLGPVNISPNCTSYNGESSFRKVSLRSHDG